MTRKDNITSDFFSGLSGKLLIDQSILDVFVLQDIISSDDANKLKNHLKTNREIEKFLLVNKLVTRETINKAYSIIFKLPYIELKNVDIPSATLAIFPEKVARKFSIIPFDLSGDLLKLAISRPADLLVGFKSSLEKILISKKLRVELFITSDEDFFEGIKQYRSKKKLLISHGSMPVVFLRNRDIPKVYIKKLPLEFVRKNRIVVFGKNIAGEYLLACENPDSFTTKKLIESIKIENKIGLAVFAASKEDIDYALSLLKNTPKKEENIEKLAQKVETPRRQVRSAPRRISFSDIFKPIIIKNDEGNSPALTIDQIIDLKNPTNNKQRGEDRVNLRLIGIEKNYLDKLSLPFITKYRLVIFGEEDDGALSIATDNKNREITAKAIEFIKNQHPVRIYITSREDIDFIINLDG